MTRPLDEVLADARDVIGHVHSVKTFAVCRVKGCGSLRRELEEHEAKLTAMRAEAANNHKTETWYELQQQLAEVRQLLGRGEPELQERIEKACKQPGIKELDAAMNAQPRPASPAMRALAVELLAALEDLYEVQNGPPLITRTEAWNAAIAKADAVLPRARAELGEEADRG